MTNRRFDFSAIVLATVLLIQAGIASYGLGLMKDVAGATHERLMAVAHSAAR